MILVTGARGFVGQALGRHLDASGESWRALEGDVRDLEAVAAQAEGCRAIVHLAQRVVDQGAGFAVNVDGTRIVLAAARSRAVRRVVLLSTVGVYGHGAHRNADEHTPVSPDTPYSRSKAEAERLVLAARREGGVEGVVLRTRFVVGRGDHHVVPRIHGAVRRSPVWVGGGQAMLSLVGVDDLAAVLHLATERALPEGESVFHVTDGDPVSFRTFATELCEVLGGSPPTRSLPLWMLMAPVRAREMLLRIDPETTASSLSSIRLRLVATDQSFASHRLARWLPELAFTPRRAVVEGARDWYAGQR
ncbi:MAG: NAD-dependent epimerase/dehydratase family protein [Deltaproteobacteria bacterium]|nr:MAG: NAD-dependent epimerase/dehydratase family protein [Deltaproteobacteria bacterium]